MSRHWIFDLAAQCRDACPAVLVTVAAVHGSAPRAPGTHMLVTAARRMGTIGGGQLELRAIELARTMLADAPAPASVPAPFAPATAVRLERFPLGARVGQCCGGVVFLCFERLDANASPWIETATELTRRGERWGRRVDLTGAQPPSIFTTRTAAGLPQPLRHLAGPLLAAPGCGTALDARRPHADDARWLLDVEVPDALPVVLFGAGHVGRALVRAFAPLPMRVTWVDSRADEFDLEGDAMPDNLQPVLSDTPVDEVAAAPAGALFLVLTYSHALDFELTHAILKRGDFRFFGLIGSHSKRARFEQRLLARGMTAADLARITCPIGLPGVSGKEPEVIAVAVAAQLLTLRQQAASAVAMNTDAPHHPAAPARAERDAVPSTPDARHRAIGSRPRAA